LPLFNTVIHRDSRLFLLSIAVKSQIVSALEHPFQRGTLTRDNRN
jgi:hypothetical protein